MKKGRLEPTHPRTIFRFLLRTSLPRELRFPFWSSAWAKASGVRRFGALAHKPVLRDCDAGKARVAGPCFRALQADPLFKARLALYAGGPRSRIHSASLARGDARLEAVTLRNPADGCRYIFRSRTLRFGAVATVLRYNVFSRIVDGLCARLFGIPALSFFGDFGALVPDFLSRKALGAFDAFCKLLGITLKAEKADVGHRVTFLGLRGPSPWRGNAAKMHISLTGEKASQRPELIRTYHTSGSIHALELESLIGKLGFSQTCLFGNFARAQMRYIYKKIRRLFYVSCFFARELHPPLWWETISAEHQPRIPMGPNRTPTWVLFAYAATMTKLFAAALFKGGSGNADRASKRTSGAAPPPGLLASTREIKSTGLSSSPR